MKRLPQIYKNDINKKILNNKVSCNVNINNNQELKENKQQVDEIISEIFNGFGYSYNIPLEIITKDKIYNTSLIAKNNDYLITTSNEIIKIKNIIEIKKKKVQ